jgi:hypothetical protein
MKRFLSLFLVGWLCVLWSFSVYAWNADDPFVLIPESNFPERAENNSWNLWQKWVSGKFREFYNMSAEDMKDDVGWQISSGIMNWDTILTILGRVVTFLANGALVVGAAMIIYAWYLYVASVFAGDYTWKANDAIKRAIIGIVIVIFSYAIIRIVLHAFL